MNDNEVFNHIAGYQNQGTGFGDNAEQLILRVADRIIEKGWLEEDQKIEWAKQWHKFAKKTQCIESDCNYDIGKEMKNAISTATGGYQFLTTEYGPEDRKWRTNTKTGEKELFIPKNPVEVGINRSYSEGVDSSFVASISDNPINWDEDQADVMFIAHISGAPESDMVIADVGKGVNWHSAYKRFHYRGDIDKDTKERMDEYYGKEE
jgi:hypothetical protein